MAQSSIKERRRLKLRSAWCRKLRGGSIISINVAPVGASNRAAIGVCIINRAGAVAASNAAGSVLAA